MLTQTQGSHQPNIHTNSQFTSTQWSHNCWHQVSVHINLKVTWAVHISCLHQLSIHINCLLQLSVHTNSVFTSTQSCSHNCLHQLFTSTQCSHQLNVHINCSHQFSVHTTCSHQLSMFTSTKCSHVNKVLDLDQLPVHINPKFTSTLCSHQFNVHSKCSHENQVLHQLPVHMNLIFTQTQSSRQHNVHINSKFTFCVFQRVPLQRATNLSQCEKNMFWSWIGLFQALNEIWEKSSCLLLLAFRMRIFHFLTSVHIPLTSIWFVYVINKAYSATNHLRSKNIYQLFVHYFSVGWRKLLHHFVSGRDELMFLLFHQWFAAAVLCSHG